MYTFQARIVDNWRSGRILLAGDAVHLMPPFAGQGMCSGIRDAANVAWKLDLVLRGIAGDDLLDTYPEERIPQVGRSINASVELGRIISELDTVAAAERDTRLIAMQEGPGGASALSSSSFPLAHGVLRRDAAGELLPLAGDLTPQGRVARGTASGLFDDVVGRGFVLITTVDPHTALGGDDLAFLERIGAHLVRVLPSGTAPESIAEHEVVDLDDVYLPYLAEAEQAGVLIRPDFYAFGAAADEAELPTLVSDLRGRLTARVSKPSASVAG
jgi:flavoprotein hydroxylase